MESKSMSQDRPVASSLYSYLQVASKPPGNNQVGGDIVHRSCINATLLQREGHSIDRQHVGGDSIIHFVMLRVTHNFLETPFDDVLEPVVHFLLAPKKSLPVLDPLEVADGYAAGIGQNVRYDEDAFAIHNIIRHRSARAVGALAEDTGLQPVRIFRSDLVLDGRWNHDVGRLK